MLLFDSIPVEQIKDKSIKVIDDKENNRHYLKVTFENPPDLEKVSGDFAFIAKVSYSWLSFNLMI